MFRSDLPVEDERIHNLSDDADVEFVKGIQALRTNSKPLNPSLIKSAAKIIPGLNLVLFDQAGFYAGHVTFLPIKRDCLEKIIRKEIQEHEVTSNDFEDDYNEKSRIFYFYSLYADSIANSYYLMNKVLEFFRKEKFKEYTVAGMAYHPDGVNMHREMGLKVIWEEKQDTVGHPTRTFVEGNYDMFLFGKMR